MTRRVAVQSVLVIGVVVAFLLASGIVDVASDSSGDPGKEPGAPAAEIDLIDESEIEVSLGAGWTLVDDRYIESTAYDLDGFCPALTVELWGQLTVWTSEADSAWVLLVGSDWRSAELRAQIRRADCTPELHTLLRENIVGVVWFDGGSSAVVDTVLESVREAMDAAEPYLTGQPRPEEARGVPAMVVEAKFVADKDCVNAGTVYVSNDSWSTDHHDVLPVGWREPDGVTGTLEAEGLDGTFTGPDGFTVSVTQDFHELECFIG